MQIFVLVAKELSGLHKVWILIQYFEKDGRLSKVSGVYDFPQEVKNGEYSGEASPTIWASFKSLFIYLLWKNSK